MTGDRRECHAPSLRGIIGACLTPFDESGGVDFAALEREIQFMLPDVDALTVASVEASEYTVLSAADRREVMRQVTKVVDGRVPVILGATAATVWAVLELAEFSAELGADFVQVLMPSRPWGGQPSASELVDFFERVGASSPLPIVAYHNPAAGADPPVETWIRLAELPSVRYFKESSRDLTKILRLIEEIDRAGHAGYFTTMQPLLTTLLMGGSGGTMPPPATRIGAQVVGAFRDGDLERARDWQRVFSRFPGAWGRFGLAPVMKAAMRSFGVDIGDPLPPYRPLPDDDERQVTEYLSATLVLDGDDAIALGSDR